MTSNTTSSEIPISVIVMTKDEERNIEKCLKSVDNFGEIFVVDSGSKDRTCQVAEEMGAQVVQFRWEGKYPKKKQWCLENLPFTYDWVLYVDADEEVYPSLSEEMRELMVLGPKDAGYFVGYDYVFQGRVLKFGHRVYKLVLFDMIWKSLGCGRSKAITSRLWRGRSGFCATGCSTVIMMNCFHFLGG
jgi:glycosyltransferase involved in cell wall biosynthesis